MLRVSDIMRTDVATIREQASVADLARLLDERGISEFPWWTRTESW